MWCAVNPDAVSFSFLCKTISMFDAKLAMRLPLSAFLNLNREEEKEEEEREKEGRGCCMEVMQCCSVL